MLGGREATFAVSGLHRDADMGLQGSEHLSFRYPSFWEEVLMAQFLQLCVALAQNKVLCFQSNLPGLEFFGDQVYRWRWSH